MTKEELIYHWENQLVLLEVAISDAEERGSCITAAALDYQKNQLIACIADLKQLNGGILESEHKLCPYCGSKYLTYTSNEYYHCNSCECEWT